MSKAREVIAEALFQYKQGHDQHVRGKRPWGREGAEWRVDAVLDALNAAGFYIAHQHDHIGQLVQNPVQQEAGK